MADWIVVAEDEPQHAAVSVLADRSVLAACGWADDLLDDLRTWRGIEEGTRWTTWPGVKALAQQHRVRVHGGYGGPGTKGEYQQARKALLLVARALPEAAAVVLARDADGDAGRAPAFGKACEEAGGGRAALPAVADPRVEVWFLHGAGVPAGRDAKATLRSVTGGDAGRRDALLREPAVETLVGRGVTSGLADYLAVVEARLVPLLSGRPAS